MDEEQQRRLARDMQAALEAAHRGIVQLDARKQSQLRALFESAAAALSRALRGIAGPGGTITALQMDQVQGAVDRVLQLLRDQQGPLIEEALREASGNGADFIERLRRIKADDALHAVPHGPSAAAEVLNAVMHGTAEDGLTLSDRIWRNYESLRAELLPTLQRAVLNGDTARDATRAALKAGQSVSDELLNKIEMARAGALGEQAAQILASDEAAAYANAARVFRTEMDRAHILTTRAGIYAVDGVAGTRFLLSPNHPRYDICDMHAGVNLFGLGPGVYPKGKSPLPAHPNTLSYEEVVFEWELTDADRNGRHDLMDWLAQRSDAELYGVLGQSQKKVAALRAGLLQPDEITTPWRQLKNKYENQLAA